MSGFGYALARSNYHRPPPGTDEFGSLIARLKMRQIVFREASASRR